MTTDTPERTAAEQTSAAAVTDHSDPATGGADAEADTDADADTDEGADAPAEVLFATNPSAKPTGVVFGIAVLVGAATVGYLLTTPGALGNAGTTRIGVYVVSLVFALVAARLLIRLYLLTRFQYVVTEHALRWEYSLFFYSRSRELPLRKLRGYERTQNRIQAAFDVGTVEFLTAANGRGLGHLAFENVADSTRLQRLIRNRIELERV